MSALEIICAQGGAGAALLELLKFLNQPLAFLSFSRTRQQQTKIVESGFVVRFGLNRSTKSADRFVIFLLLHKDLANINVRTYIGCIYLQHLLKFSDGFLEAVLRSRDQSENVVRRGRVRVLRQSLFSSSF